MSEKKDLISETLDAIKKGGKTAEKLAKDTLIPVRLVLLPDDEVQNVEADPADTEVALPVDPQFIVSNRLVRAEKIALLVLFSEYLADESVLVKKLKLLRSLKKTGVLDMISLK